MLLVVEMVAIYDRQEDPSRAPLRQKSDACGQPMGGAG